MTNLITRIPDVFCALNCGQPERIMIMCRRARRCKDVHTEATAAELVGLPQRLQGRFIPRCSTH